jgi:hypothetical protein
VARDAIEGLDAPLGLDALRELGAAVARTQPWAFPWAQPLAWVLLLALPSEPPSVQSLVERWA